MATTDWIGNSGDWGDASNWSNGVPNDSSAVADFAGTSKYTASISNESFTVGALNITDPNATLDIKGVLTVDSPITNTGTITVEINGAQGSGLDIYGDSATGTSVEDSLGTVKVSGGGSVNFDYIQTIDNATFMLGSGDTAFSGGLSFDGTGSSETFTLGKGVTIETTGGASALHLDNDIYTLLNQGTIEARKGNDRLTIEGNFINSGTIAIANNDTVAIEGPSFINNGKITVTSDGVLQLEDSDGGGVVTYKTADLGTIRVSNGGTLDISAVLDNSGAVLRAGGITPLQRVTVRGTIEGGTILDNGGGFDFLGGILDNVKYRGTFALDVSLPGGSGEGVEIDNGITLTGANGTGKGVMEIGAGGGVGFRGTQTINNATITLGTNLGGGTLGALNDPGATTASTLTLGSGLTLVTGAATAELDGNGRIVNRGTIVAATSGGTLTIDPAVFVNDARLTVDQGQTVMVGSTFTNTTFTNNGAVEVTDGSLDVQGAAGGTGNYQIDAAGTLAFDRKAGSGLSILFYGTGGTLQVGAYNTFAAGYIGGFASGDSIDLKNFAYSSTAKVSFSDNMLVVSVGKRTATLNLVGDYAAASFAVASDGGAGTIITYSQPASSLVGRSAPALGGHNASDNRLHQFVSAIASHSADSAVFHTIDTSHGTGDLANSSLLAASGHP
jgi:hypothetical protein